jgi:hypothetical protein
VEDLRAARKELQSRGVEFVTDVRGNDSEAWFYFRGPDGYLYELWQTPRPLKALPLQGSYRSRTGGDHLQRCQPAR